LDPLEYYLTKHAQFERPHIMKEPDPDSQEPIDNEEETQEFANKLEERLIDFAVRIIKLASALPNTPAGRHVKTIRVGKRKLRINKSQLIIDQ
jgi:hypothetical protein